MATWLHDNCHDNHLHTHLTELCIDLNSVIENFYQKDHGIFYLKNKNECTSTH